MHHFKSCLSATELLSVSSKIKFGNQFQFPPLSCVSSWDNPHLSHSDFNLQLCSQKQFPCFILEDAGSSSGAEKTDLKWHNNFAETLTSLISEIKLCLHGNQCPLAAILSPGGHFVKLLLSKCNDKRRRIHFMQTFGLYLIHVSPEFDSNL